VRPFDSTGTFIDATERGGELRRSAVRGASAMMFSQVISFGVQIVATVVLSRLLNPQEFGVVAIITTFSVLLVSCGQIGLPEAVVQRKQVDHTLVSDLFWLNSGFALLLTILFASAGPLFAKFYRDPRLTMITVGVAIPIFLTSFSVIHVGLLKRGMRFSAVSLNEVAGRAASVCTSILFAWLGWGYWALIFGAIAQPVSMTIGAWALCRWVPSLPTRRPEVKDAVRFASHVYTRFTTAYIGRNADNFIVGFAFGPTTLGFYKRAYDLFNLPSSQLLYAFPVGVSTLSRLADDPPQYRRFFLSGLAMLTLVGMAVGGVLTLAGPDLVVFVLGQKWEPAGRIFQLFGPGIGPMLIYSTAGVIQLSLGTTERYIRWGFVELFSTLLMFVLAVHWGPLGIAGAWTFSYWALMLPALWYAGKPIGLGIPAILKVIWKSVAAGLLGGYGCHIVFRYFSSFEAGPGELHALARATTISVCYIVLYFALITILHGGFAPLQGVLKLALEMIPGRRRAALAPVEQAAQVVAGGK
jgi:O-antigen/teichoic acid export membrane protein